MQQPLLEAAGGQVLVELALETLVAQRLTQQKLTVTPEQIAQERKLLAQTLSDDSDQAAQLLASLIRHRGTESFNRRLKIHAGLRALVQDQVAVSVAAVEQEYALAYGPRYQVRLLTTSSFPEATQLVHRARGGETFLDLVVTHSTDPSRAYGGLLAPMSAQDPAYPQAVRAVAGKLKPGEVSDPISLEQGFAVIKLERQIPAQDVAMEQVRDELTLKARRQLEQVLMQQLARTMLTEAKMVTLSQPLEQSWQVQRERVLAQP